MNSNKIPTPKLTDRFEKALVYANRLHSQQFRKGGDIPYISHLLSVAALVLEDGGDEDEAIAALLHDAIEDQGGKATRKAIANMFGERVTCIVDGCTESDTMPKPPWEERKQVYIDKLRHASPSVRRVSLADKLHNARSISQDLSIIGEKTWDKFTAGKPGTLWFYQTLLNIFLEADSDSWLVKELSQIVNSWK